MEFTKSQKDAISAAGSTILVSAAAGSGKTFTLTQRIIKSIIGDGENCADISRTLIVTFTRAAAAELKIRISSALSRAIAEHPSDSRLQKQLIMLGNAKISTIDSFFTEPVRANFEKLGFTSTPRLADSAELEETREQILANVLDGFFEKYNVCSDYKLTPLGYSNDFTELLAIFSGTRDSQDIYSNLFELYSKLITSPRGVNQLKDAAQKLEDDSQKEFFLTDVGKFVSGYLISLYKNCSDIFESLSEKASDDELLREKYLPVLQSDAERCRTLIIKTNSGYAQAKDAFINCKTVKITALKSNDKSNLSEYIKNTRSKLNKLINEAGKAFLNFDEEEIKNDFKKSSEYCMLLYSLLDRFDRLYAEEKRAKGVCEFSDMPRYMLKILQNEDGTPSDAADNLYNSFDEVYIDEYQDVNEIQDRIFELIGRNHRFMVGDIKQSIYGFRDAEPDIFAGYRKKFPTYLSQETYTGDEHGGRSVFMSDNFRCDENIIKFTNLVCSHMFTLCGGNIGYTKADDLVFSKALPYENYISPKVNINIIQKMPSESAISDNENNEEDPQSEEDVVSDEAIVTANEIANLLRSGIKADNKPIKASDITVLVRDKSSPKPLFEALKKLRIDYVIAENSELFDGEDMKTLVSLLESTDNPHNDTSLCALLTSNAFKGMPYMSLEEIITVRQKADKSDSLFDAVVKYGKASETDPLSTILSFRCASFVNTLEKLRSDSRKLAADLFLKLIASMPEFSKLCESRAFIYMYDCACKYVRNSWNGLFGFLKYFKRLIMSTKNSAEPEISTRNAVTVMTIHKSKGLEFNTCFLYGFGKRFNSQRKNSGIIFDRSLTFAAKLPKKDNDGTAYKTTALYEAVKQKLDLRNAEEEMRILYVALTRARERLYISASLSKSYVNFKDGIETDANSPFALLNHSDYISWIISAISNFQRDNDRPYNINVFTKGENRLCDPLIYDSAEKLIKRSDENALKYSRLLKEANIANKREKFLLDVPSKAAASKASPDMLDNSVFIPFEDYDGQKNSERDGYKSISAQALSSRIELMRSSKPDFESLLSANQKPTATEKGSVAHLFLQYCDFENAEKNGFENEILRLTEQKYITRRSADIINRGQIEKFFKSGFFRLIRNASEIKKEFRFGFFRNAEEFTAKPEIKELVHGKKIYIQGSIDLILVNPDGSLYICDYKSDRITDSEKNDIELLKSNLSTKHKNQLLQYRRAVKDIFGKAPDKIFIYSLPFGEAVELNL